MENHNRDALKELFERFVGDEAGSAADEIRCAEQLLGQYPAPQPDPSVLADIKRQIAIRLSWRYRFVHNAYRLAPAAAAVIVFTLIGLYGNRPATESEINYASLIPAAIWESNDLSSDDVELAYFAAELRQIEAEMRALEAGDGGRIRADVLDEMEMELMLINMDFWQE